MSELITYKDQSFFASEVESIGPILISSKQVGSRIDNLFHSFYFAVLMKSGNRIEITLNPEDGYYGKVYKYKLNGNCELNDDGTYVRVLPKEYNTEEEYNLAIETAKSKIEKVKDKIKYLLPHTHETVIDI